MQFRTSLPFDNKSGSRDVVAEFPEDPTQLSKFIFCTDGLCVTSLAAGLRDELTNHRVGLVGVHSSPNFRGQEYVEGRDELHFQRHEHFFVEVVRRWLIEQFRITLTRENSVVFGYSCGGSFAVSMGMRHTDLFASAIALSIAGRPVRVDQYPPEGLDLTQSRFYLAAGESEPGGMKSYMKRLASWIQTNGGLSEYRLSPGGHEFAVWQYELLRGIEWLENTLGK
ncbi:MAG: hypothetical protein KDA84_07025 [Planctomycetaceae bacterium]|nr:hypothetical protein [Planctomycetaceae bacterium]